MTLNLTNFDGALKQHYTDEMVENMVYADNPFFAMCSKMEEFGGRNLPIPIIWGNPQARSASFSTAQNRDTAVSSKVSAYLLTRVADYSLATIDNQTIEASKGDANAFLEAATVEIDGAINSLTRSVAVKLFGDGSGQIAQVAPSSVQTTFATNQLQLANPDDVVKFEVNDVLVFCSTATGSVETGSAYVLSVDRSNGYVYVANSSGAATNLSSLVSTIANGDYIFHNGDAQNGGASPLVISGNEAWNPFTAPTSGDSFFGVDRSQDVTRLSGQRLDGTSMSLAESLVRGAAIVAREGHKIDKYWVSYKQFANLENELGAKRQYVDIKTDLPNVGFRGMVINGPRGPIDVIPDQNVPANRAYGHRSNAWKLCSIGKAVRVIDTDGLQMLRQATSDGVEVRYAFYGNLGCWAPAANICVQLSIN